MVKGKKKVKVSLTVAEWMSEVGLEGYEGKDKYNAIKERTREVMARYGELKKLDGPKSNALHADIQAEASEIHPVPIEYIPWLVEGHRRWLKKKENMQVQKATVVQSHDVSAVGQLQPGEQESADQLETPAAATQNQDPSSATGPTTATSSSDPALSRTPGDAFWGTVMDRKPI